MVRNVSGGDFTLQVETVIRDGAVYSGTLQGQGLGFDIVQGVTHLGQGDVLWISGL